MTHAARLFVEAMRFPRGSLDRSYRLRAAWKLTQMARGIPVNKWTEWQ